MTPAEVLRAARAKIERPECWIKGDYAVSSSFIEVEPTDNNAICFCSKGALMAVVDEESLEAMQAEFFLERAIPDTGQREGVISYNDRMDTTHANVLALFDRAIALAEGCGAV